MIELVATEGYETVTVRRLIKLAGVSTGAFYSQFDGVDECFLATYQLLMERTEGNVAASRTPQCAQKDQAARSVRALIVGLLADPDAARLVLMDVFAGGPAALKSVRMHEARLEAALRGSLDRRGGRVSTATVCWIANGVLRFVRSDLASTVSHPKIDAIDRIVNWGQALVDQKAPDLTGGSSEVEFPPASPTVAVDDEDLVQGQETELILTAVMKLAAAEGFWRLSPARVSKAAGVPKTHFNLYFEGIENAFLAGIRRMARRLFGVTDATKPSDVFWKQTACRKILDVSRKAAADPMSARLTLSGILEPGVRGLTCREALISEIANAWLDAVPADQRPDPVAAEMATASLWAALARSVDLCEPERLLGTGPTFAYLFTNSIAGSTR
ncbi:MAG: TetR/AcrR family transcriptional regulator [Solirubrobacterales bacterium]